MPTLKDVAKRAGVSIATVSYCINNTHNLSAQTKAKVNRAIRELNYIPNTQARNLKSRISKEICVILPDLEDDCFNEFLKGIIFQSDNLGYSLTISCSYNDMSKEQKLIEDAIGKNCAGLVLVTCQPQNTDFFSQTLIRHSIPTVFLERLPRCLDVIYFGFDNYASVDFLTRRLLSMNYRDIALVTGPADLFTDKECVDAFTDVLEEAGITPADNRVLTTDGSKEGAFKVSLRTWIDEPPQAVITSSQSICQGVIEACRLANLRIPEDICIITLGVDNWNKSAFYPHIIRTSRPAFTIGSEGLKALVNAVEDGGYPENRFHLLRDSVLDYPLELPMARNLNLDYRDISIGTLNIACSDLPTIEAIRSLHLQFYHQHHIRLNFEFMEFHELFQTILEDSRRTHPHYDLYLYDTSWFPYLQHTGCLMDLTDSFYVQPDAKKYFVQKNLDNCTEKGRIYGFPIIGGTQFLLYRKDYFNDPDLAAAYKKDHNLSLRPPKTWKEFNAVARFFTKKYNPASPTEYGTAIETGLNEEMILEFEPRLWGHGGNFFDHHGRLCLNTPQNVRAVSNFMESFQYSRENIATNKDVFQEFVNGNAAMVVVFTEYAAQIQNSSHSRYLHTTGYSIIPGKIPVNVGWHFGLSPNCQKVPYVNRFFHWLHDRHNSYYMSIVNGASALEYPYRNHELKKLYPWIDLTADAMDSCRSRIYPQKGLGGYLPPFRFEKVVCDALKTHPRTETEIIACLEQIQDETIRLLSESEPR